MKRKFTCCRGVYTSCPVPGTYLHTELCERPHRTRIVNVKYHRFDVYIGRRMPNELHRTGETDGLFGKPRWMDQLPKPDTIIFPNSPSWVTPYVEYLFERLKADEAFFYAVQGLYGLDLACWCKNVTLDSPIQPFCHGDVLVYVIEAIQGLTWRPS